MSEDQNQNLLTRFLLLILTKQPVNICPQVSRSVLGFQMAACFYQISEFMQTHHSDMRVTVMQTCFCSFGKFFFPPQVALLRSRADTGLTRLPSHHPDKGSSAARTALPIRLDGLDKADRSPRGSDTVISVNSAGFSEANDAPDTLTCK